MTEKILKNTAGDKQVKRFEEIEHTADKALRIFGHNFPELLVNAALGMNSLMLIKATSNPVTTVQAIELAADDSESMLVEWLSELAYLAESDMAVFTKFDFKEISPAKIVATLYGYKIGQMEKQIKAVTYHNLEIISAENGLTATVVFDV